MTIKIIIIAFTLFLGSCSKIPRSHYYLLDTKLTPDFIKKEHQSRVIPLSVRIKPPNIGQVYNRLNLVYKESPFKIGFYNYHKWVIKPEKMLRDSISSFLKRAGLFKNVLVQYSIQNPDLEWQTEISSLEMNLIDNKNPKISFKGEFKLYYRSGDTYLWKYKFNRNDKIKMKIPEDFVQKISAAFAEEIHNSCQEISEIFKNKPLEEILKINSDISD